MANAAAFVVGILVYKNSSSCKSKCRRWRIGSEDDEGADTSHNNTSHPSSHLPPNIEITCFSLYLTIINNIVIKQIIVYQ